MLWANFFCLATRILLDDTLFSKIHVSDNIFNYEGVDTSSEGIPQALLENHGMEHYTYIEWIQYICLFNSG